MIMLQIELMPLENLKPYPGNYRKHPPEQLAHLVASLQQYGWARNVVVSSDGVILAGHGIVEAARQTGLHEVPVHRLEYASDDPRAAKFLVLENEVSHLADVDDRMLTELLREIAQNDTGLIGTGYDEQMVQNLILVTRPKSEIPDLDAAAEWIGMPDMGEEQRQTSIQLIVWCDTEDERNNALQLLGMDRVISSRRTISVHFPLKEREPRSDSTLQFIVEDEDDE
jgi:hypothetical protein